MFRGVVRYLEIGICFDGFYLDVVAVFYRFRFIELHILESEDGGLLVGKMYVTSEWALLLLLN